MADNNTTEGVASYIKPTSDTIDFIKSVPLILDGNEKNIEIFDKYVKIKSAGLNIIIPLIEAADGQKEWNEAIAKGTGDIVQDLLVDAALTAVAIAFIGTTLPAGAILAIGATALTITWISPVSLGDYFEWGNNGVR